MSATDAPVSIIAGAVDRNAAMRAAEHPWLLFVDAGDTVNPDALARAVDLLNADPSLDAVHGAWALTDASGRVLAEERCTAAGDLFDLLACRYAFPIRACVMRRSLVLDAGGFDPSGHRDAEWTLLQRLARRGARFGHIADTLVVHRAGDDVASAAPSLDRALGVVALGHAVDPDAGVSPGAPFHAGRLASPDAAVLNLVCEAAGGAIGRGDDPLLLLDRLRRRHPVADRAAVAECIVRSVPLAAGQPREAWAALWDSRRASLERFFAALERRAEIPGLARAMAAEMQRLVLPHLADPLPAPVAGTGIVRIEITEPIADVGLEPAVERVHLLVLLEGSALGVIELPAAHGAVIAGSIRDAIADRFSWRVLASYLERTEYASLELRREHDGWSAWRDGTRVAHALPDAPDARLAALHEAIGWQTFLAALWSSDDRATTLVSSAIDRVAGWLRDDDGRARGMPRRMILEAGTRGPLLTIGARNVAAELHVSGIPVAATEYVVGRAGIASGRALRAALIDVAGFELCRIVVREALFGMPLDTTPLSERIARADARRKASA